MKGLNFDKRLAAIIEHSMIRHDADPEMVKKFCREAVKYGFVNVCLSPCFVAMAYELLEGTGVKVCTAIAFPYGTSTTDIKVAETLEAIKNGASEIDLAINVGMLKAGEYRAVKKDVEAVVAAAGESIFVKVAVETGQLTDEEKVKAGIIAKAAGAHFLKVAGGPGVEDLRLLRRAVGKEVGLKAEGGIKDYRDAMEMVEAGADRIGTCESVNIVMGA